MVYAKLSMTLRRNSSSSRASSAMRSNLSFLSVSLRRIALISRTMWISSPSEHLLRLVAALASRT